LGDQAGGVRGPEEGEVDVGGPPPVEGVVPGIGARSDGEETVLALLVGERAPRAGEVGIERRIVLVLAVQVAPGRIALPELDQRLRNRPAIAVEQPPGEDDALAQRLPFARAGEIDEGGTSPTRGEARAGDLREPLLEPQGRALGRALDGAA